MGEGCKALRRPRAYSPPANVSESSPLANVSESGERRIRRRAEKLYFRLRDRVQSEQCVPVRPCIVVGIPGVDDSFRGIRGGIWRDTGRYREIPGDTRGYDEIRSAHDVFTRQNASVKRENRKNRTRRAKLRASTGRDLAVRLSARFLICRAPKRKMNCHIGSDLGAPEWAWAQSRRGRRLVRPSTPPSRWQGGLEATD